MAGPHPISGVTELIDVQKLRTRARLRRWVLLFVVGLASLALGEVLVRRFAPVALHSVQKDSVRLSENPKLLYELNPDYPGHAGDGLRANHSDLAAGASGGDRPTRACDRTVLLLGDSLAYGMGLEPEVTVASALEQDLFKTSDPGGPSDSGLSVCVRNAGVPGYSILQAVEVLRLRLSLERPSACVLLVCLNDWTPYTVEFDALMAKGQREERQLFSRLYDPKSSNWQRWLYRSHIFRHLQLISLRRGWMASDPRWEQRQEREGETIAKHTSVKDYYRGTDFYREAFGELRAACATADVPLLVLLAPIGAPEFQSHYDRRLAELRELCQADGSGEPEPVLIDLRAFLQAKRPEEPYYKGLFFPDDAVHFNVNGAYWAAKSLLPALLSLPAFEELQ